MGEGKGRQGESRLVSFKSSRPCGLIADLVARSGVGEELLLGACFLLGALACWHHGISGHGAYEIMLRYAAREQRKRC